MSLIPNSLLARTALVIVLALLASQLASVLLFRYYAQTPRMQLIAMQYIGHLKTIRSALEIIPPAQHREFIAKLREERSIRVIPPQRITEAVEPAPDSPGIATARERLREQFGPEADIYVYQRPPRLQPSADGKQITPPPVLITKLPVGASYYWVVFPRSRVIEPDYSIAWIGWGVLSAILSLVGAVFLMWRVNRPLEALATAAAAVGQGKNPPPVTEMGPSEVRAVATAFNQMRTNHTRLDQERATFLAGVSHDLRTPLSRLRLGIEMLPTDPVTRNDLEKDITDINVVIDQFLDFARDESSEPPQRMNLTQLALGAIDRAARMQVTATSELAVLPPMMLRSVAMQRAIDNLINNAMRHGGGEILIQTRRDPDGASVLSVLDRGPGIPPGEVERLKKGFTRLDSARSGESGAGLGLAIVERIARMHGARFDLLPRPGGGTEARLTFTG
ncbi:MAG: HAMP domain-containing protein [Burkholderiales bacterium]|nr:HAMP domain-containing protein [Burkholderiales bacterium]